MNALKSFWMCNLTIDGVTECVPQHFITRYVSNFKLDDVKVEFDESKVFLGSYLNLFVNKSLPTLVLHDEIDIVLTYSCEVDKNTQRFVFNSHNGYVYIFTSNELLDMFLHGKVSVLVHQAFKKNYDFVGVYDEVGGVLKVDTMKFCTMQYFFNVEHGIFRLYHDKFKTFKRFYTHSYVYTDVDHFVSGVEHRMKSNVDKTIARTNNLLYKIKIDMGLLEKPKKDYTNCEKFTDEHFEGK